MRTDLLRKTVLTTAGVLVTGGAVAAPASAVFAAPTLDKPAVQADRKGERELRVDYEAQDTFFYCGPAATRNALSVQGKDIDQHEMAERMGTTEAGTNSINDITPIL
ncbi:C39 family peptidase, partial [Micromonospora sp. NPDC126480]|uniref:C39 family peptidase n=1 Tax=Micromonospora sp. NPDC126480 TaxID=3155312 RepID=UPI0033286D75